MPRFVLLFVASSALASGDSANTRTIDGHVFVDVDGDGVFSAADRAVSGVHVAFDTQPFVQTDSTGGFAIAAPAGAGEVWVRVPDGYAPGPVFATVPADGDATLDLPLRPIAERVPFTFVVLADPHIGKGQYGGGGKLDAPALRLGMDQALALDPPPQFYVIAGDITNVDSAKQVREAQRALATTTVPFVPVPGNHDWVDDGANYRQQFGPPNYSFDSGGVHFVVLNDNPKKDPDFSFLARDLDLVSDDRLVVVFVHRPPTQRVFDRLADAGVDYLFTGHWHSNRYTQHGPLRQVNTESIVRGGLDFTPAGYRIVTIEGDELQITHHTVVERPVVSITQPAEGCLGLGPLRVLAAVETGAGPVHVTATVGARTVPMEPAGGWVYAATIPDVSPWEESVAVVAHGRMGTVGSAERALRTCASLPPPRVSDWPQFHGGPEHRGHAPQTITPPLRSVWVTELGEHLQGGSPVLANGRLYVSLVDLDDGADGGVVALDPTTGTELWRYVTVHSVRNAPAVADGLVVLAANDGNVHALDAATGQHRWSYDLGARVEDNRSAMLAAPTIADGVVYAGVIGRFAALDLATGHRRWSTVPAPTMYNHASYSAATVADDIVIGAFGLGGDGVIAWETASGRERWRLDKRISGGVHAAPVRDGDTVYVLNSSTELSAVSLRDGSLLWRHKLHEHGTPLSMAVAGTPALHDQMLIVPTQYESVVAIDLAEREVAWSLSTELSDVHVAHNKRLAHSVPASPLVTGDVAWIGSADGMLRAVDASTGELLWRVDLGVPILAAPAPGGEVLFVATFDGTVRALVHDPHADSFNTVLWLAIGGGGLALVLFGVWWRGRGGVP